ncbi:hypothetical protein SASPL_140188 [Salvia splendens]|uniref:Uncharacterized protein n=2 Tax=Salvia splendens TaxID=180675 RepID=A0A8X8WQC2_SALSN|nr:hypothetical protein SASPL_140188 [Salvia splendens]
MSKCVCVERSRTPPIIAIDFDEAKIDRLRRNLINWRWLQMGFIMEFAENLVLRLMEDPNERDRKARERLYERKEQCKKTIEMHRLPLRPYGFWTFERHNAQIFWDEQISNVQGRRDPYDEVIEEYSK